jgi:hypothetical protein
MISKRALVAGAFALGMVGFVGFNASAFAPKAASIKDVMKAAFAPNGGKLLAKATGKEATAEDKEKFLECVKNLTEAKPPKGSEESWKKKTDAIVKAATNLKEGKEGANKEVRKATNCKACHDEHK